ncbi:movement protein [Daphne virus 1]|nr:movement protein [Daphne virus 1]
MKGIISVNDAKSIIASDGSITQAINSGSIYEGKYRKTARKREVNVKILANDEGNYLMRSFPLFDQSDVNEMRAESAMSKYIHIGCLTISIEPLIHHRYLAKYGKSIEGLCVVYDNTFRDMDQSIISLHQFDLSTKRADFICQPNHCLSVTDENLMRRVSIMILFNKINVEPGDELFNVCIGHITTCTNTLNPSGDVKGEHSIALRGTVEVPYEDVKDNLLRAVKDLGPNRGLRLEKTGEDDITMKKKTVLSSLGLISSPKVVIRRNYVAPFITKQVHPPMARSASLPRNSLDLAIIRCAKEGLLSNPNPPINQAFENRRKDCREKLKYGRIIQENSERAHSSGDHI